MPILKQNDNMDIAAVSSEYMTLEYKNGVTWRKIDGITDYSVSGAATPVRDIIGTHGAIGKRPGRNRAATVTFQSYFIPNDRHWQYLQDAYINHSLVEFRIRTDGERVYLASATGSKFQVTNAGVVTFTDESAQDGASLDSVSFGIGSIIHTDTANYVVDSIDAAGAVTVVNYPAFTAPTAIAAGSGVRYAIYSPAVQLYEFSAYVTNVMEASLSAEGELMTPLTLTCRTTFPKPTVDTASAYLNLDA